jgi:hypothetical protein
MNFMSGALRTTETAKMLARERFEENARAVADEVTKRLLILKDYDSYTLSHLHLDELCPNDTWLFDNPEEV